MAVKDVQAVFGGRLAEVRRVRGINQKELSELAQTAQSQISAMEKGRYRIQIELLAVLVERYGVNANWFLSGEGEMFQSPGAGVAPTGPAEQTRLGAIEARLEAVEIAVETLKNRPN